MGQKHKHHDVIVAWAAGAEIEQRNPNVFLASHPPQPDLWRVFCGQWYEDMDYRIKPEPPAKVYPVTGMKAQDCLDVYATAPHPDAPLSEYQRRIANAALRHAIDNELLVDPVTYCEEVREAVGRRKKARDMAIAIAVRTACMYGRYTIPGEEGIDLAAIIASVKGE